MLIGSLSFANSLVKSEINIDLVELLSIQNKNYFDCSITEGGIENCLFNNIIQVEILDNKKGPCRWRVCTYSGGVLVGCSEWTYGECLEEVLI